MTLAPRPPAARRLHLELVALEGRALLSTSSARLPHAPAHVEAAAVRTPAVAIAPLSGTVTRSSGYRFYNFDGPSAGTNAATGTNLNGIANNGVTVGDTIPNSGANLNFTARPRYTRAATALNIGGGTAAAAFGVNSSGTVVGSDGNGNAFTLSRRTVRTFLPTGANSATAFGINDRGVIVGQEAVGSASPGFIRPRNGSTIEVDAPSGPNTVNAQGINNNGLVVGFFVGTDGQTHGLTADQKAARNGTLTATAIADPTIPAVAGEPGATFTFSQVLAVNDKGIAVGYYGDSTTSQHGFLYNTRTGQYTFLDNPNAASSNGVEVTQITGITNSGEISGFYSDATGLLHGFVASR